MLVRNVIVVLLGAGLAACGGVGGPSNDGLKRACIDSGAEAYAAEQVCGCLVREINSNGLDKAYILQHWEAQKEKTFGKSILPNSVDQSVKQRCQR